MFKTYATFSRVFRLASPRPTTGTPRRTGWFSPPQRLSAYAGKSPAASASPNSLKPSGVPGHKRTGRSTGEILGAVLTGYIPACQVAGPVGVNTVRFKLHDLDPIRLRPPRVFQESAKVFQLSTRPERTFWGDLEELCPQGHLVPCNPGHRRGELAYRGGVRPLCGGNAWIRK